MCNIVAKFGNWGLGVIVNREFLILSFLNLILITNHSLVSFMGSWVGGKRENFNNKKKLTDLLESVWFRCADGLRTPSPLAAPY